MNILFVSAPGAGKGTQSKLLEDKYNLISLSTGDLIRKEISKGGKIGKELNEIVSNGSLIEDKIVFQLMIKELENITTLNNNNGIIFDGFPRNIEQAKLFEIMLEENNINIDYFINLDVDYSIIEQRVLNRLVCNECGKVYNALINNNKTCSECKGLLKVRIDDNLNSLKKRFDVYQKITSKLIPYYENRKNTTVISIKIEKETTIENVFNEIDSYIKEELYD